MKDKRTASTAGRAGLYTGGCLWVPSLVDVEVHSCDVCACERGKTVEKFVSPFV